MRNFKKSFKIIIRTVIFLVVLIVLNETFRFIVMPPSYARYILGELNRKEGSYDCIILGASHGRSAINPYKIDEALNCNAINMSIPSETVKDSYYLLKESFRKNNPKTIIFDIDYQYWYKLKQNEYWETFIYEQLDFSPIKLEYIAYNLLEKDFRVGLTRWAYYFFNGNINLKENVKLKTSKAYWNNELSVVNNKDAGGSYVGKGYFYRDDTNGGKGKIKKVRFDTNDLEQEAVHYFKKMVQFCKKKGIRLVCITSPITPATLNYGDYETVHNYFVKLCKEQGVEYYDFNYVKDSVLHFDNADFVDYDGHMKGRLAEQFSVVLAKVIKEAPNNSDILNQYFYKDFQEYYSSVKKVVTNDLIYAFDYAKEKNKYNFKFKSIVIGGPNTKSEVKVIVRNINNNKTIYEDSKYCDYERLKEYSFDVEEGSYEIVIYARTKGTSVEYEELCRKPFKIDANEVNVYKTKLAVGDIDYE
ncbi:MAG: hypothetical protein HFJ03_06385 [Lachnospira sp.]|nr:hypothetical protein [Lachnospira sp.]